MMVSFILCLLPALLATTTAQNLTCEMCSGTADTCKNATQTCMVPKATGGCIAAAEENTLDGSKTSFLKGCIDDYNSGIQVLITFTVGSGKYLRINTARCNDTDNCNSAVLEVPKVNTTSNGLQCPTCFALNTDSCNSQMTPCTGDETYCIDFTGMLTTGTPPPNTQFVAKGCATASAQSIQDGNTLNSALSTYTFTKATSNPAGEIPNTSETTTAPKTTTTSETTTTPKPTTATTNGGSPALGQFSFAHYLPGLTGLLLVKLLS